MTRGEIAVNILSNAFLKMAEALRSNNHYGHNVDLHNDICTDCDEELNIYE